MERMLGIVVVAALASVAPQLALAQNSASRGCSAPLHAGASNKASVRTHQIIEGERIPGCPNGMVAGLDQGLTGAKQS